MGRGVGRFGRIGGEVGLLLWREGRMGGVGEGWGRGEELAKDEV